MSPDNEKRVDFNTDTEEMSFSEIVIKMISAIRFLWKRKALLVSIGIGGMILGFTYAHFFRELTYSSRLTFAVEEKAGGNAGSLAGLASQFGFDVGGGSGLFSSDNLVLLLRSKNIIESSLLAPVTELDNNHLLNLYFTERYGDEIEEGRFTLFDPQKPRQDFSRKEDSLLNLVVISLQKKIIVTRLDKKASIISLELTDVNEKWAYLMTLLIIEKAKELYLDLKVGKSIKTIKLLEARLDSVKSELDRSMGLAAMETDQNQSVVLMKARVPAAKKQMEVQLLSTLYGELVKNLEISKFTLEREEPVIQIIDAPSYPLKKIGKKRLTLAILLGFSFTLVTVIFLFVREYLRKHMPATGDIN